MTSIAALYREVYERPDDDEVRLVLADALVAAGDPRGELIVAQLRPGADHEQRAMRLLQRHGLAWLGALRGAVIPLAYDRGFVARVQLAADVRGVLDAPEWATVHAIEGADRRVGFALSSAMRSLRRVSALDALTVLDLATRSAPQLRGLTIELPYAPDVFELLERYLPPSPVARLVIRGIGDPQTAARLAAAGRRHRGTTVELTP